MTQKINTAKRLKKTTTLGMFSLYLLVAVDCTVTSALLPDIVSYYHLQMSMVGLLTAIQSAGQLTAAVIGALFSERFDKRKASSIIIFLFSIAVTGIGLKPAYPILFILFFIRGLGITLSTVFFNSLMSDLYLDKRNVYINFLHIFYCIGSSLGPMASAYLLTVGFAFNQIYTIIGCLCFIAVILYTVSIQLTVWKQHSSMENRKEMSASDIHRLHIPFSPQLLFLFVTMFCYCAHQVTITNWLPIYLSNMFGADGKTSSLVLSAYWFAALLGKFLYALLFFRYDDRKYIMFSSFAACIAMIFGMYSGQMNIFVATVILGSFITGSVYGLFFSLSCDLFPSMSGSVTSITTIGGQLGGLIFTWLLGVIAEYISFVSAMFIIMIMLLLVSILMGLFMIMSTKKTPQEI